MGTNVSASQGGLRQAVKLIRAPCAGVPLHTYCSCAAAAAGGWSVIAACLLQ